MKGVQNLHTEEARTLLEQRVPDQQGSVFQDLGREPVTIVLDGFLFGEDVLSALEKLRTAQSKAEPQSFAADIAVGTDLTEVLIETFRVRQVAGYANRYRFVMRLKEHVEPPQPASAAQAPVNQQAGADAAAWGEGSVAASAVLQDPASLPAAIAADPSLLQHLDAADLGDAVARNMDGLNAGQLDGLMGTLANADPAKAAGVFDRLKQAGALGSMIAKYVEEGVAFARGIDVKKLSSLMQAFKGGLQFLQQLKAVVDSGGKLVRDVEALELPDPVKRLI